MNRSKKIGIAIFLLLIGSLETKHAKSSKDESIATHYSLGSKKVHKKKKSIKKSKVARTPKKIKASKKNHKASKPKAPKKSTVSSRNKADRKARYQKKEAKRLADRQEAKRRPRVSLNDARFKTYKQEFGYGVTYYHKESQTELFDAVQSLGGTAGGLVGAAITEKDVIEITKSKPAPQVTYVLSTVYENLPALFKAGETVEASFGIQASFAKKDDAYQGTHKDAGVAGNFRTRQSIKKYTVKLFGQYELFQYYGWKYNFKLASGLSYGALRDLRLYEEVSNKLYYTGQRVEAKNSRPTVDFGFNITKEAGPLELVFAYDVGYVKQSYKDLLTVEEPDRDAPTAHHTTNRILRGNSARHLLAITAPTFKLWAFNFKLGAAFNF